MPWGFILAGGPPIGAVWLVISFGQSDLIAERIPSMRITVSEKEKMYFCGILRKILNPVPNPGLAYHFQHFAILNNMCCETLAKNRVTEIIRGLYNPASQKKKKKT